MVEFTKLYFSPLSFPKYFDQKFQGGYKTETAVSLQQFCLQIKLDSDNLLRPLPSGIQLLQDFNEFIFGMADSVRV